MGTVVIANLTARGLARSDGRRQWLRGAVAGRAELVETTQLNEVAQVAHRVASSGSDFVVLAGGDGTFMAGVSALASALGERPWPKVGLLPLGTVGTVARNLGPKAPPEKLLAAWLAAPQATAALPRATLCIKSELDGVRTDRVGFIVGTGLVARFFEVYEAEGAGGIPHAARIALRVFSESLSQGEFARRILTPIPCLLEVDGKPSALPGVSLLCAAVVRDLGLGMKVCYRAGESPQRFHLVASGLPPHKLGPRAPLVMLGKSIGGANHVDDLVERFSVEFPSQKGPFVIDGDTFYARRFEVSAGPIVPIVCP